MEARNVSIQNFVYDENNCLVENTNEVLCVVQNQAGESETIMVSKKQLIEAGYELALSNLPAENLQTSEIDCEWSESNTAFVLGKYAEYLELVGPMKVFNTKKEMWHQIAQDLETTRGNKKSYLQCQNRYKTIMKRKRAAKKNNATSGSKRMRVEYEAELEKIAAVDDSFQPEVLQSANHIIINKKDQPQSSKSKPPQKNKVSEILLQIHLEKENNRQKRHETKMELLKSLVAKQNNV